MGVPEMLRMETATDLMLLDGGGRLVSFRSKAAPGQEFLLAGPEDPAFVVQCLARDRPVAGRSPFRQLSSLDAEQVDVEQSDSTATFRYRRLGGYELDVTVTVRADPGDRFSRWRLSLDNRAGLTVTDVQFPFITVPYRLAGAEGSECLLWPLSQGQLYRAPRPERFQPDVPETWQFRPENGDAAHYPGYVMAQLLAYYNDRAGLYLACEDNTGRVKLIRPAHRAASARTGFTPAAVGRALREVSGKLGEEFTRRVSSDPGIRLGIAHVGDWPEQGERDLGYDVVLGSFTGDWYAAAELYREWSLRQPWATPLHRREDVPEWLLESPPHIILRIQGELDDGPAEPNEEFLPYRKAIPLLDELARRIEAPLVPVVMSWERPGPWIYPDCFPPAGGAESLKEFCDLARERGWHVGSFCNGTRWVMGHRWSGYDGTRYFEEQNGADTVCRTAGGELWSEGWDASWRPSYPCCLGVERTREIALDFVRTLKDMGLDWIQFLDQNVGCCTFACYGAEHGHPVPGRWMTEAMEALTGSFLELGARERAESGRHMAFSVECAINEYFIPRHHVCDIRVVPPGHPAHGGETFVPLYHFLYHELILIQGGFGSGPEPYHMPIRSAYNLVTGEIPGAVMKGNGELLNLDTMNWAPWDVEAGSNDDSIAMLRATAALRRGPAKDCLVYGRMQRPSEVRGIRTMEWEWQGRQSRIPALFHSAWQAPDGRFALVLANWTAEAQEAMVVDPRLREHAELAVSGPCISSRSLTVPMDGLPIILPPLSCAAIEAR